MKGAISTRMAGAVRARAVRQACRKVRPAAISIPMAVAAAETSPPDPLSHRPPFHRERGRPRPLLSLKMVGGIAFCLPQVLGETPDQIHGRVFSLDGLPEQQERGNRLSMHSLILEELNHLLCKNANFSPAFVLEINLGQI